jgi:hypothetical protein
MKFDDLKFVSSRMGVQAKHEFPNGYMASVVKGPYTYGGDEGLYELAVIKDNKCCYDTPITDDVEGYQTPEEISALLERIEALP